MSTVFGYFGMYIVLMYVCSRPTCLFAFWR